MTTENQSTKPEPKTGEIVTGATRPPEPPQGVTEAEAEELKTRAAAAVERLQNASGSKEMEVLDNLTTVGAQTMRHAGLELDLLRTRVGDMLKADGPTERVTRDLVDLRVTLDEIDPAKMSRGGLITWLSYVLPFMGRFRVNTLKKIAIRYEPVSKQVTVIETRLREGRLLLTRDNIEMRKLVEQVESQQTPLRKNAYLGELLLQELDKALAKTEDPQKRGRIQNALNDVITRVQDLRFTEEVHVQLMASLEMTRQNNTRLGQALERTLTLATNMVMVGLAIQAALVRQSQVLQATQQTREFMGKVLVDNAAAINRHTAEIGNIYNSPVIALDKLTQAHNELIDAINLADQLKAEGIASARENIDRVAKLAGDLERRMDGLRDPSSERALEA